MRKVIALTTPFLPRPVYFLLFGLLGLVYLAGAFVPLMDNDSAHHANIALRMYLTGDYVNLVDYGKDYLDKPHLHFWLCALSYQLFGVTTFAYKFPSLLFTIGGIYSTYRLGRSLYDHETGKLAALIIASAFAFILANNDVRMDAILTACIAFAGWQLVDFIQHKRVIHAAGAALGLALGFCTKGHIAVFVPAVGAFFYILYRKEWSVLVNWKSFLLIALFALFIAPVVYCYYLQYNLHPEKVVRGKDHINGVKFILLNQSVERFSGTMGSDAKHDYFFFLHSFLWAFAPWSLLAFAAIASRIRGFFGRAEEWLTTGVFLTMLLVVSFSGFKLPHYLNVVFPFAAVFTAMYIFRLAPRPRAVRTIFRVQLAVVVLLLLLSLLLHAWAFPVRHVGVIAGLVFLLALLIYFFKSAFYTTVQRSVCLSVTAILLAFYLLNTNFYPRLLTYQAGNELARQVRGVLDPAHVYFWKDTYSSSFNFYTGTLRREFDPAAMDPNKPIWLLFDSRSEKDILASGYRLGRRLTARDYEITKLDIKFVDPDRRDAQCSALVVAELIAEPPASDR